MKITLPDDHQWVEVQGSGPCDSYWECKKCGASYYIEFYEDNSYNAEFISGSGACDE